MTRLDRETMLQLLEEDREFLDQLLDEGILGPCGDGFGPEDAEHARVARTLVRDLGLNWAGVEVVLHMRSEMIQMRRQVAELLQLMRSRRPL